MAITIRSVDTIAGVDQFQRLEQLIWASPPEDVVPLHVAITVIHNGGGIMAAFDDDGPEETGGMIGLTFWFAGIGTPTTGPGLKAVDAPSSDGGLRLKMCSHMAGVLPDWQGKGIGLKLKVAQRDAILAQSKTDWVTWTYDPLFRTNGVFNMHRLGAVCNTYARDWYGVMKDGINAGVPSDRCQVDWWLRSDRVQRQISRASERRASFEYSPIDLQILPTSAAGITFRAPVDQEFVLDGRHVAVPIPDDIATMRRADHELGMAWRLFMRHTLESAFAAGYIMVDCIHLPGAGWHYLLEVAQSKNTEHGVSS